MRESGERFGYEWNIYSELHPEYEEQFRRWTAVLEPASWVGRSFLDAGCGMGRNSYWAMRSGAASGVAMDIDDRSLAAARLNLAPFPTVRVEKASIYHIPYQDAFDLVFSIGVIHHLDEPEAALAEMVRAVKPGGRVMIWVYGQENNRWVVFCLDPLRKLLFSRLPLRVVHALSLPPTLLLWLALRLGLGRIEYFQLLRRFSFRHLRSIVFDQMIPRIAHYWPQKTVLQLLEQTGLKEIKMVWVNQMSWSAIGTRPKN